MMMRFILLIALSVLLSTAPTNAQTLLPGNPDGSTGTGDGVLTGGACDFGAFLSALGERESNNNYQALNSLGYMGRWQFGDLALQDIGWKRSGVWTGNALNYGIETNQDFLNSTAAQDQAIKEWMDLLAARAENFGVTRYLGQTINGCEVTWSGIIAGRHLCGYGNRTDTSGQCHRGTSLIQYLESNGTVVGVDGYGTPVSEYVCRFSGLNMPYEHGAQATDCSSVNDAGETGNPSTPEPPPYTGTPGGGHVPDPLNPDYSHFLSLSESLKHGWVAALQSMTTQLSTFMLQQVQIIGTFFDAKHQLETQRLLQEKAAQAHKDYQPSEQMCEIGTFVRNLTNTERRADLTQTALMENMLERANMTGDAQTLNPGSDERTKRENFLQKFCNTADNAAQNEILCDGQYDPDQINADISFTETIDLPLTLDINLIDEEVTNDEENIFAFLDYIFMHDRFPFMNRNNTVLFSFIEPYQDMRSLMAMRSVAKNSFTEIIAQKTAGPDGEDESVGPFIKALMRDFGIADEDIEQEIGRNPSYYAQMEVLTKKIYQHPEFVANLYDKPANVKRIRAALTAIKLMQDRDIHDALQRREMLMSIFLEIRLREKQKALVQDKVGPVLNDPAGIPEPARGSTGGTDTGF